jgi:hypothetical protein
LACMKIAPAASGEGRSVPRTGCGDGDPALRNSFHCHNRRTVSGVYMKMRMVSCCCLDRAESHDSSMAAWRWRIRFRRRRSSSTFRISFEIVTVAYGWAVPPAAVSCIYIKTERIRSPRQTASLATRSARCSKIVKATSGSQRLRASTGFARFLSPRFQRSRVCRPHKQIPSLLLETAASG